MYKQGLYLFINASASTLQFCCSIVQGNIEARPEPKPVEPSKKRRKSVGGNVTDEEDNSMESFDWWTKYHASLDASHQVSIPHSFTSSTSRQSSVIGSRKEKKLLTVY